MIMALYCNTLALHILCTHAFLDEQYTDRSLVIHGMMEKMDIEVESQY